MSEILQKLKRARRIAIKNLGVLLLPTLVYWYYKFVLLTSKEVVHFPDNIKKDENYIMTLWHNRVLFIAPVYHKLRANRANSKKFKCIMGTHSDGVMLKKATNMVGFDTIDGSSTRGGVSALINAQKALQQGHDVGTVPDGPRGPLYKVAIGAIALAQKTNKKIIALSFSANKYWQLPSWDKLVLVKPFGTLHYYASEPFDVQGLDKTQAAQRIREKLDKIDAMSRKYG